MPSDSHAAELPSGGEEPVMDPDPGLRELVRRCRHDHSGQGRLVVADRLAAMGLQRAAARQVRRALTELEAQGGEPAVLDQLRRWLARWPADRVSRLALAKRLAAAQDFKAAILCLQEGLQLAPEDGELWSQLARLLLAVGRYGDAIPCLIRLAELEPANAACRTELGHLFRRVGYVGDAIHWHGEALAVQPDSLLLHLNHLFVLPLVAESAQQIAACRQRCEKGLRALEQQPFLGFDRDISVICHLYYLIYHDHNDRELLELYGRLITQALGNGQSPEQRSGLPRAVPTPGDAPIPRIRIGFLSGFFSNHSNARAFDGLILHLDRHRFEVVLIHLATSPRDDVSARLEACCQEVVVLPAPLDAASARLTELRLDLLFYTDLGMHPFATMLATRRSAPVQATGWGVPQTSGLPGIDYYVSGDLVEPPEAQEHYSETLVRLPGLPCCYRSEAIEPLERDRTYYFLPPDRPLWGCLHRLEKLHPDFDLALEAIARAVPDSLFVFVEEEVPSLTSLYLDRLARSAPTAREQVVMLGRMDWPDFLALAGCLDVLLDPFHFGSGITLYETIHTGTPVVTLEGRFLRSRFVAAAYRLMEVKDPPVAATPAEYVERAVALMQEPQRRELLREEIAAKAKDNLYDRLDYVRGFEDFALKAVAQARRGEVRSG
ncbi:MAG: tetratricopeptide repeat protein [Cyanobacteria bacterium]|nr:tetratricopeptide repeat protein [Cyanobacteriota bacterium]